MRTAYLLFQSIIPVQWIKNIFYLYTADIRPENILFQELHALSTLKQTTSIQINAWNNPNCGSKSYPFVYWAENTPFSRVSHVIRQAPFTLKEASEYAEEMDKGWQVV